MRLNVLTLMCLSASLTFAAKARADDSNTLVLDLPPSQRALDARAAAKARDAASAAAADRSARQSARSNSSTSSSRGSLPSRGGNPGRVVGRLGEVVRRASIYRTQRESGRLATIDIGTYIGIDDETERFYGVYMADGTTGWISKKHVTLLDSPAVYNGTPAPPSFGDGSLQPRTGAEFFTGDPQALLGEAYKYLGVRYQWGGNTETGIDCSGFMKKIFFAFGYSLPRTAAEQTTLGMPVMPDQLQCGDQLYFGHGTRITHTGLYIGNGNFIHSSASEHGVAVSRLSDQSYWKIFVCARR